MSGNSSRKYKNYQEMLEHREYFGDLKAHDDYGILQLTALGASYRTTIINNSRGDLAKVTVKRKKKDKVKETTHEMVRN
jgi:hypothetical protein